MRYLPIERKHYLLSNCLLKRPPSFANAFVTHAAITTWRCYNNELFFLDGGRYQKYIQMKISAIYEVKKQNMRYL